MRLSSLFVLMALSSISSAYAETARVQTEKLVENLGSLTLQKNWYVGPVDAQSQAKEDKFCAMAGNFGGDSLLAFSRNQKGFASAALEFPKDLFEAGKNYTVRLKVDDALKPESYEAKAANPRSLVVQLGEDQKFFEGLTNARSVTFYFEGFEVAYALDDFMTGLSSLDHCVSTLKTNITDNEKEGGSKITPDMAFHQTGADTPSATPRVQTAAASKPMVPAPSAPENVAQKITPPPSASVPLSQAEKPLAPEQKRAVLPTPEPKLPEAKPIPTKAEKPAQLSQPAPQVQPAQPPQPAQPLQFVRNKPVAVIEEELLKQQADLDRQARILAERTEFLERERIRIEKQKSPEQVKSAPALDQEKITEAKEKISALEEELAKNKLKIAALEKGNINKTLVETQQNQKMIADLEAQQKTIAEKLSFLNTEEARLKAAAKALEDQKEAVALEAARAQKAREELDAKRRSLEEEKNKLATAEQQKTQAIDASAAALKEREAILAARQQALLEKEKNLALKEQTATLEQAALKDFETAREAFVREKEAFVAEQTKLKTAQEQAELQASSVQNALELKESLAEKQAILDKREAELLMREQKLAEQEVHLQKQSQLSAQAKEHAPPLAPSEIDTEIDADIDNAEVAAGVALKALPNQANDLTTEKVVTNPVSSDDKTILPIINPQPEATPSAPAVMAEQNNAEVTQDNSAISRFLDNIIINHHGGAR